MTYTIMALVNNKSGVLTRVSGLFSRRGYSINSIAACSTEDKKYSRITIELDGDEYVLQQMIKQLAKLIDIKKITKADENTSIFRELCLVKVEAKPEKRSEIIEIKEIYKAKVVDLSLDSMILEITGEPNKIDGFIQVIEPYGIMEMARTGVTALNRGDACIKDVED